MITEGWSGAGSAAELLASIHVHEDGPTMAKRVAQQAAERADRQAAAEEAEARAAAEDQREARALRFSQMGIAPRSMASVFADASRAGDEDAELEAARAVVAKIERRKAARQEAARFEAEQVAAVSRADSTDLLGPAKKLHAEYLTASRAAWSAATAGTPRQARGRRPFAGEASRSEHVECAECRKVGASASESFLIHQDPSPPKAPAVPSEAEQDWLRDRGASAERRTPRHYAEISR